MGDKFPQKIKVPINIDATANCGIWRRATAVLPPHAIARHAFVPAIRISLREDNDVERIYDVLDLEGCKGTCAEGKARSGLICSLKLFDEVDENISTAPF